MAKRQPSKSTRPSHEYRVVRMNNCYEVALVTNGVPHPVLLQGDSLQELAFILARIREALSKPVVDLTA